MSKNYENGIVAITAGGSTDISKDIETTGNVYWVDSVNGNDANNGTNRNEPKATLDSALTSTTANNGDIVIVEANHAEVLSAGITFSKAGVRIFGLGTGTSKPSFTCDGNISLFSVTAKHVEINNFQFPAGTTATNVVRVNANSDGIIIKNCDFTCGQFDETSINITTSDRVRIEGCTFLVVENGPIQAIDTTLTCDGIIIDGCIFDGGAFNWDNAAIFLDGAVLNFKIVDNTLLNKANIVSSAGTAKGQAVGTIAGDGSRIEI